MRLLNLTKHNIKIINEYGKVIKSIPTHGEINLVLQLEKAGELDGIPVYKRIVKDIKIETNTDIDLKSADAVIVSAQVLEYIERIPVLKNKKILTVGETVRERHPDGTTVIKGAKYLVIN